MKCVLQVSLDFATGAEDRVGEARGTRTGGGIGLALSALAKNKSKVTCWRIYCISGNLFGIIKNFKAYMIRQPTMSSSPQQYLFRISKTINVPFHHDWPHHCRCRHF